MVEKIKDEYGRIIAVTHNARYIMEHRLLPQFLYEEGIGFMSAIATQDIEKLFNDKAGNEVGHSKYISDKKQKKKEKAKKIALGQKADDDEREENIFSMKI